MAVKQITKFYFIINSRNWFKIDPLLFNSVLKIALTEKAEEHEQKDRHYTKYSRTDCDYSNWESNLHPIAKIELFGNREAH